MPEPLSDVEDGVGLAEAVRFEAVGIGVVEAVAGGVGVAEPDGVAPGSSTAIDRVPFDRFLSGWAPVSQPLKSAITETGAPASGRAKVTFTEPSGCCCRRIMGPESRSST